jgi:uncharacterized membrane protein YraQ (UPF0718 family)
MPEEKSIKEAVEKSGKGLWRAFPMILGTILLVSLINSIIPKSFYTKIFQKNILLDSFIGDIIGSISAGNPATSYIFGGELLKQGISLIAVTAFIVAWVTVGLIQLPAESTILGKKFAILRNLTAFILAIIVSIITVLILGAI